jgi:hypothetical protein
MIIISIDKDGWKLKAKISGNVSNMTLRNKEKYLGYTAAAILEALNAEIAIQEAESK